MLRSLAVTLVPVVNTSCHKHCNCHITEKHNEELEGPTASCDFPSEAEEKQKNYLLHFVSWGGRCNVKLSVFFCFFLMGSQYFWWEEVKRRKNLSHEYHFGVFACCAQGHSAGVLCFCCTIFSGWLNGWWAAGSAGLRLTRKEALTTAPGAIVEIIAVFYHGEHRLKVGP